MRILALEPYYGGSHKAFLDGLMAGEEAQWTLLHAPANHWKWRMRHTAVTMAQEAQQLTAAGKVFDVIFCSSMLDLASFRGLAGPVLGNLPTAAYFHENQLTYPVRHDEPRDLHFALIHLTTALSADAVWFNSAFHRDEFCEAMEHLLKSMPAPSLSGHIGTIREKSHVMYPGIDLIGPNASKRDPAGPLHIGWASRWEHDKNPEDFFETLEQLDAQGIDFHLSVLGESFRDSPACFSKAKTRWSKKIVQWGYLEHRAKFQAALQAIDVIVSTAEHEFFGLAMLEAAAAGAYPLLPKRLAYPEIFNAADNPRFFYDGSPTGLTETLVKLATQKSEGQWPVYPASATAERFAWSTIRPVIHEAFGGLITR